MNGYSSEDEFVDFLDSITDSSLGDDCGFWPDAEEPDWLVTTDSMVQGVHFDPDFPADNLATRLFGINLSDVAAMGGYPRYMTTVVNGFTNDSWLETFFQKLVTRAENHDVTLIGGDLSSIPDHGTPSLNLTLHAEPHPKGLLLRNKAQPGQQVAVTGNLGGTVPAWDYDPGKRPERLQNILADPPDRLIDGQTLVKDGVRCGIDISDGLVKDLQRVCRASGLGAKLHWPRVPIHPLAQQHAVSSEQALTWALTGGEDYELLVSIPDSLSPEAYGMTVIGKFTEEPGIQWDPPLPDEINLNRSGFDHFQND